MLELDKNGYWWLDGSVIEPWVITQKWDELETKLMDAENELIDAKLVHEGYEVHIDWLKRGIAIAVSKLGNCPCCKSVKEYFKEYLFVNELPDSMVLVDKESLVEVIKQASVCSFGKSYRDRLRAALEGVKP